MSSAMGAQSLENSSDCGGFLEHRKPQLAADRCMAHAALYYYITSHEQI
jgi:hypothetical protein